MALCTIQPHEQATLTLLQAELPIAAIHKPRSCSALGAKIAASTSPITPITTILAVSTTKTLHLLRTPIAHRQRPTTKSSSATDNSSLSTKARPTTYWVFKSSNCCCLHPISKFFHLRVITNKKRSQCWRALLLSIARQEVDCRASCLCCLY